MQIEKNHFFHVGSKANLSTTQLELFWKLLGTESKEKSFSIEKLLLYLGACIIIASMTLFMTWGGDYFGSLGVLFIALGYAFFFATTGTVLWHKKKNPFAGGIFITLAVIMTPLIIYGFQSYFQLWLFETPTEYEDLYDAISGNWIFIEMGTILIGMIALYFFPFSFLTAPISIAFWFLSLDLTSLIFAKTHFDVQCSVTLLFGLCLIGIGRFLDMRKARIDGFWPYLIGTLAFWGGLGCFVWDKSEWVLAVYLLINLAMMFSGILLQRSVLIVFGALGTFVYLSHLAYKIFEDSLLFPFVLSLFGLLIIYLGVLYQRNRERIQKQLVKKLPFLQKRPK